MPARTGASAAWRRAVREGTPGDALAYAVEIEHPDLAVPARAVTGVGEAVTIGGDAYAPLRFELALADDVEGQAPRAELRLDNVGRPLTQWIEAAQGGTGATATIRALRVEADGTAHEEWTQTLDVADSRVDQRQVVARLGHDPLLGRPAVPVRHDPDVSPGLF